MRVLPLAIAAGLIACALGAAPTWAASGVAMHDGLLTMNGQPFFTLGAGDGMTTPEELQELGLNTFWTGFMPAPFKPSILVDTVNRFWAHGIPSAPILHGFAYTAPWPKADLEANIRPLATHPGVLCWYNGDDLGPQHIEAFKANTQVIRAVDHMHPVLTDYIGALNDEVGTAFRSHSDMRCQYRYPLPLDSLADYAAWFDRQRQCFGDPLWTWIQVAIGGSPFLEAQAYGWGAGSLPEPEQVRLLSYVALNRGVRGLMFFHIECFRRVPEQKAEIALLCHEIKLVEGYLAAGRISLDLRTSDASVRATSFDRPQGSVVELVVMGPEYHRWVDEAMRENISFTLPYAGAHPRAVLVTLPEPLECPVVGAGRGKVRVTVPRLEVGGLVLVTADAAEIERVTRQAKQFTKKLAPLALEGAAGQLRKVAGSYWRLGGPGPGGDQFLLDAQRRLDDACAALAARQPDRVMRLHREILWLCRRAITATMAYADTRRQFMTATEQRALLTFYDLPRLQGFSSTTLDDKEFRFLRDFAMIGPFPLEMTVFKSKVAPAGLEKPYPPERELDFNAVYDGVAGPVMWTRARTDLDGALNFTHYLDPADQGVAYATAVIVAPHDMTTTLGLGSGEGARVWVNGALVHSHHDITIALPNAIMIPVSLRAGRNVVLVKSDQAWAEWKLYLSVRDPEQALSFAIK